MPDNKGTEAAAARAARLREQISGIESGAAKADAEAGKAGAGTREATPGLSPRDFVQERMRELDSKT